MFPWVFRATVLTHWTSRQTPTAARVRRAHSAGVSQSNKSCRAFIPFGPRLYVAAARRSVNVAMNFRYGWTLIQNRDPTWYDMYPIMEQFPCIYILIRMVWSISKHIGSCYVDQHVLILILRYMYMWWHLNSWSNDGVSAWYYYSSVALSWYSDI